MSVLFYAICFGIFVAGFVRGTAAPAARSVSAMSASALFWVSLVGLASLAAGIIAIFGIAAVFDERSSNSLHGFDRLLTVSRQTALVCTVLAMGGHAVLFASRLTKMINRAGTSTARGPNPPRNRA